MPTRRRLPEAISTHLAAELLDVHVNTIRRWILHGYLRAYHIGPKPIVRIPRSEISRMRTLRAPVLARGDQPEYPSV